MVQSELKVDKPSETWRYCCSNPNCHKVFSKPKIIKFYVCPTCQTTIDLNCDKTLVPSIRRRKGVSTKEPAKPQKQELTLRNKQYQLNSKESPFASIESMESLTAEEPILTVHHEAELPKTDDIAKFLLFLEQTLGSLEDGKPKEKEIPDKLNLEGLACAPVEKSVKLSVFHEPIQNVPREAESLKAKDLPKIELPLDQRLVEMVNGKDEEKEIPDLTSNIECQHFLGYLKQRTKGEVIPEECVECSTSIECLLHGPETSKESVKEIKKWYA